MTQQIQLQPGNLTNTIVLNSNSIELANNHQLVKIIDVSLKLIDLLKDPRIYIYLVCSKKQCFILNRNRPMK